MWNEVQNDAEAEGPKTPTNMAGGRGCGVGTLTYFAHLKNLANVLVMLIAAPAGKAREMGMILTHDVAGRWSPSYRTFQRAWKLLAP